MLEFRRTVSARDFAKSDARDLRWVRGLILACAFLQSAPSHSQTEIVHSSDETERKEAAFFCEWLKSSEALPSKNPIRSCSDSSLSLNALVKERNDYFSEMDMRADAPADLYNKFEDRWLASIHGTEVPPLSLRIDSAETSPIPKPAHKPKPKPLPAATTLDDDSLCVRYKYKRIKADRDELTFRKHFTDAEWTLIDAGNIVIGGREEAIICAWGRPNTVNRTLTAVAEERQYVFDNQNFVYTINGRIISIQDHH
jgi:hypothetical protein